MLEIILVNTLSTLIATELLMNPGKLIQHECYPSGTKEADKYYSTDKPSKKYPLLKLDITTYDPDYNKINAGIYSVEYSPQETSLLIGNGKNIIKAPVFQVKKLSDKVNIPTAKIAEENTENNGSTEAGKLIIIYKNENLEVHSFLYLQGF